MANTPYEPRRHLPDGAAALRHGRRGRGWSIRGAARELGLSAAYLCDLENGKRCPSVVVARLLIAGYRPSQREADLLCASAVPGYGRDRPPV